MLAVKTYPRNYIASCRALMAAQLETYERVAAASKAAPARSALDAFEPLLCNHLVLVLDSYFVHRTRGVEGKDGNPLNEVRMLCTSILHGQGKLVADTTIKYKPESAVLGLAIGDEIRIDLAQLRRLSEAFFAELARRFS